MWTVRAYACERTQLYTERTYTIQRRGTGGTTKIASFLVKRHAIALDHDINWCKQATDPQQFPIVSSAQLLKKLSFICVDKLWNIHRYVDSADIAMELMS